MTNATETTGRTYRTTLFKPAPYPLNWDSEAELFATEAEAMAKAAEWARKYPKNVGRGIMSVKVESWTGVVEAHGCRCLDGFKVHLDTKRNKAARAALTAK
jgi:hypothetical protein